MREDIAKVIVTDAYRRAAEALDKNGFVLLIGEPASGKTTIASLLAMSAVDSWDAQTLVLDDPKQVIEHWNPHEPSQFFWFDDAFGVTQYEESLVYGWNRILPRIQAMVDKGAKVVLTSRDYIYSQARNALKESTFPLLKESQVVIDVHAYPTTKGNRSTTTSSWESNHLLFVLPSNPSLRMSPLTRDSFRKPPGDWAIRCLRKVWLSARKPSTSLLTSASSSLAKSFGD